jgi:biotin carboxyl carrier protein
MAASKDGVETRPAAVNKDEETRQKVGDVAEGMDKDTAALITHDTTTRERTTVAKRAHEPLDADAADEEQPQEEANGPRVGEVAAGKDPITSKSSTTVSEGQVKAGAAVRAGTSEDNS